MAAVNITRNDTAVTVGSGTFPGGRPVTLDLECGLFRRTLHQDNLPFVVFNVPAGVVTAVLSWTDDEGLTVRESAQSDGHQPVKKKKAAKKKAAPKDPDED